MKSVDTVNSSIYAASCCNCIALFFAVFVAVSPYWTWQTIRFDNFYDGTMGTGSWAVSFMTVPSGYVGVYYGQWNYWSDINQENHPCANSEENQFIFDNWSGKYKMCDRVDGTFSIPSEAKTLQAFSILTCIFALFATCAGGAAKTQGAKGSQSAACCSFMTMICAIVSFAAYMSWEWIQDLRAGTGYMPAFKNTIGRPLVAVQSPAVVYGPAFGCAITVFICTFFSTCLLCAAGKPTHDELDGEDPVNNEVFEGDETFSSEGLELPDKTQESLNTV